MLNKVKEFWRVARGWGREENQHTVCTLTAGGLVVYSKKQGKTVLTIS